MIYAIVHKVSGNICEKHEANNPDECRQKLLDAHPEWDCDTVQEMLSKHSLLMSNLWLVPLH